MRSNRCSSEAGFSLLEVLVAFTLMALVLAVLLRVFSGGLQGVGLAEDYARATSIAESTLARVGADIDLKEGSSTGENEGRYRWTLTIKPHQIARSAAQAGQPETLLSMAIHEVDVVVAWGESGAERRIQLTTLRVGPKA